MAELTDAVAATFTLESAFNDVSTLAGNAGSASIGSISYRDANGFILDAVTVGGFTTNDLTAGTITLYAGAAVTQAGANGEIKAIGVGESIEDLQPFNAREFVEALFT